MMQAVHDALAAILGLGRDAGDIAPGQMALRALLVYALTLAIVRLGSKRLLGKATAFDVILGIMIGSVMSRGINGSAALISTIAGGATLVALHWLLGVLSYHTNWLGDIVKGKPVRLIEDGRVLEERLQGSSLSENDLQEALRLEGSTELSSVESAYLERNGKISIIRKEERPRLLEVSVAEGVQTIRIEIR